jgi:hypothetical protein
LVNSEASSFRMQSKGSPNNDDPDAPSAEDPALVPDDIPSSRASAAGRLVTVTSAENSDVLPVGLVAVAEMNWPAATKVLKVSANVASPDPSVVTVFVPIEDGRRRVGNT